jgi:hypothetical protein
MTTPIMMLVALPPGFVAAALSRQPAAAKLNKLRVRSFLEIAVA